MHHGPAAKLGEDNAAPYKTRLGLRMFAIYGVVYAGFVIINAFRPGLMSMDVGGLNLAIVYGFGLIVFAVILALIYHTLCSSAEARLNREETPGEEEDSL